MSTTEDRHELTLAGRLIDTEAAWDQVRRYCGLPWDGNPAETWAFRYFDCIDTDPDSVTSEDVLCAGALHSGLSRDDLAFFWDHRDQLNDWLSMFPPDSNLELADAEVLESLASLPALASDVSLSLLSKVLHRKRPWLIPMIDRQILDTYRPLTGHRRGENAWAPLLGLLAEDIRLNLELLAEMGLVLRVELGRPVSRLRIVDIVLWMEGLR